MRSRALSVKIGAIVLAGALSIGSGIVGAQTAPPASAITTSSAAPDARAVATAVSPIATPIPTATTMSTASRQTAAAAEVGALTLPTPALTPAAAPPGSSPVSPAASATPGAGLATGAAPLGQQPAVAPVSEHSVRGALVSVRGDALLVRPADGGKDVRVAVDRATLITQDRQHVTVAALRLGSRIVALGAPRDDGALAARTMLVSPPARPAPGREPPRAPRERQVR